MASLFSWTSRRTGRALAALAALVSLAIAVYTAISQIDRVLHLYDGLWMLAGAAVAIAITIPIVKSWPRDRAIALLAVITEIGAWAPLVVLALRAHISIPARLKGAIFFSNVDVIAVALPVGIVCAWLAIKEYRVPST